jgi:hypothetical protein
MNMRTKRRFMTPAAISGFGNPAIIMCAKVLVKRKNCQTRRKTMMPRECT